MDRSLGCGEGQFASLLARWGWRVQGMDISPQAVETCRKNGIDAVVGSLPGYLADYRGRRPAALSAIQVIEHLPPEEWLATFQFAHEALAPRGAFLIETIDPRNTYALANWFFGDITHTWPANPETLKVMAGRRLRGRRDHLDEPGRRREGPGLRAGREEGRMRILVCHPQPPFMSGGAETHANGLVAALRDAGHEAEIATIPFRWDPPGELVHQMGMWRSLDLTQAEGGPVDLVVALKFPAYLVRHPRKVVWLIHQHRTAYELWITPSTAISPPTPKVRRSAI